MTVQINSNQWSVIEFHDKSEEGWVGSIAHDGEEIEIVIPHIVLGQNEEEKNKSWGIIKWGLDRILDKITELTTQADRILYELQKEVFRGEYNRDKCRFELYEIVIKNAKTINTTQPYINFELSFAHVCDSNVEIDDLYHDYSCGYNVTLHNPITLVFARRLGSPDDFGFNSYGR